MEKKTSYSYQDLISCGNGKLFGPGNAKLPLPPMLMFDRITEIKDNIGAFKKGLIKVRQVPANRYAYYLTPKGFSEKARLTGEYLSQGFQLFRVSRFQLSQIIGDCEEKGFKKVVLSGLSDIAEIAILCAQDFGIEIVAIYEEASEKTEYSNIRIVSKISEIKSRSAIADFKITLFPHSFPFTSLPIPTLIPLIRPICVKGGGRYS